MKLRMTAAGKADAIGGSLCRVAPMTALALFPGTRLPRPDVSKADPYLLGRAVILSITTLIEWHFMKSYKILSFQQI
jgi:hypothetical protein